MILEPANHLTPEDAQQQTMKAAESCLTNEEAPGQISQEIQEAHTYLAGYHLPEPREQGSGHAPADHELPPLAPSQQPVPPPLVSMGRQQAARRIGLMATLVVLLIIASAVLLPALFSAQPRLMEAKPPAASVMTTVGQVTFTSSGQLDPSSSQGLNDIVTVGLSHLSLPPAEQSYYGWLMPDPTENKTPPLLLGRLTLSNGKAQFMYTDPDHENLLARYSGFEVTQQPSNETPLLDPHAVRYEGFIPDIPTPGDEQHYSLLDHLRHLLAKDPTLEEVGLPGGLDTWLTRNAEKILEWSSAARDAHGPGAANTIHRQVIRIIEYLDGVASASTSGDLPPGSPLLVDPTTGRIGLLELQPAQLLPGYLAHVDIHLQGLANAPGHTQAQQALALKLDRALKIDTSLFQKIRQDAIKLVTMDSTQLTSNQALSLLDDMVTNANEAYAGQLDPTTGGNINGIAWIHDELQGIATVPVTTLKK